MIDNSLQNLFEVERNDYCRSSCSNDGRSSSHSFQAVIHQSRVSNFGTPVDVTMSQSRDLLIPNEDTAGPSRG